MKKIIVTFILLLICKFSYSGVFSTDCEIPEKLIAHMMSEDVIGYFSGSRSILEKHLKSNGYKNFTDYTFTNKNYSKAIELVMTNKELLGEEYIASVTAKINAPRKKEAVISAMGRTIKSCGSDADKEFKKALDYSKFISGENKAFERYLITIATITM
jgi:hypothetical protein